MAQKSKPPTNMEFADIAGTELKAPRIAIGTWAIGGWMWGGTDESEFCRDYPSRDRARHYSHRHRPRLWLRPFRGNRRQGHCRGRPALARGHRHQGRP